MIIRCPTCRGLGHMLDGSISVDANGIVTDRKSPTTCWLCQGMRSVDCQPVKEPPAPSPRTAFLPIKEKRDA